MVPLIFWVVKSIPGFFELRWWKMRMPDLEDQLTQQRQRVELLMYVSEIKASEISKNESSFFSLT